MKVFSLLTFLLSMMMIKQRPLVDGIEVEAYINKIIHDEALSFLPKLKKNSIDMVLTDPPYFLDKLDQRWQTAKVHNKKNMQVVTSLPAGMKFDKKKGKDFYKWYLKVSKEIFRVLKPGGFFFSFSSPRLYHKMACAVDDAGFEIRDCFMWLYTQSQPKAMSLHHFIDKLDKSRKEKDKLHQFFSGWKTPQVKSCYEPIAMAQKPVDKTYLNNFLKHDVSLIDSKIRQGLAQDMFVSNVMTDQKMHPQLDKVFLVDKPDKNEKGSFNHHKTVKPLSLCKYLIQLTTKKDSIVLDPFMGSGTTALACKETGRKFIGVELNKEYVEITMKRLKNNQAKYLDKI